MSKNIKANSVNTTDGHVEFEQQQNDVQNFVSVQPQNEQKYPKELLVKSEAINSFGLHCDVVRGILVGQEYTISEAKSAIQKYIDSFSK